MTTQLWAIGLITLASFIASMGPIFLKKGINRDFSFKPRKLVRNRNIIIGGCFYLISGIFFIPALRGGDLSVLYPFAATIYIWVALFSVKYLKEKMNLTKWIAIAIIITGIVLVGFGM